LNITQIASVSNIQSCLSLVSYFSGIPNFDSSSLFGGRNIQEITLSQYGLDNINDLLQLVNQSPPLNILQEVALEFLCTNVDITSLGPDNISNLHQFIILAENQAAFGLMGQLLDEGSGVLMNISQLSDAQMADIISIMTAYQNSNTAAQGQIMNSIENLNITQITPQIMAEIQAICSTNNG
jgi:hypothetical protein